MNQRLNTSFAGIPMTNPFVLASAPPSATPAMIERAFEAGWGGAVVKTLIEESVNNLCNRFGSSRAGKSVVGLQNVELASEVSVGEWLEGARRLKDGFPDRLLIGSIMADAKDYEGWCRLARGCQEAGMDMVELNFPVPTAIPSAEKEAPSGRMNGRRRKS